MLMIRPGFLSSADRIELKACVRRQREDHGIARRPPLSGMLSAALFISNFQVGGIGR